jgi:DNA-binding transcriptional LysR family regulator
LGAKIMNYSLRQLEIFLEVAKQESMSKAAKKLFMSQSAVSAALLSMEGNYQTRLFDRIGKSLKLSSIGQALRPQAQQLLIHAQQFDQALLQQSDAGNIKVGASLTIGNYLAVEYLTRYRMSNPAAKVGFEVASTPEIVAKVLNFDADIGLVEAEVSHPSLDVTPWRDDRMVVFCSKRHLLAKSKSLNKADISQANWILREPSSGARQTFDLAIKKLKTPINIYLELTHNEAIMRAVETGIGIGCLSEIALEGALKRGDLVALTLPNVDMRRTFYFISRKNSYPSKAVSQWIELCCSQSNWPL